MSKTQIQGRQKAKQPVVLYATVAIAAVIAIALAVSGPPPTPPSETSRATEDAPAALPPNPWTGMTDAQRTQRAITESHRLLDALARATAGDDEASRLAADFNVAVLPAYLRLSGEIIAAESRTAAAAAVPFVVGSAEEFAAVGNPVPVNFMYSTERRQFYLSLGEAMSDAYLGIVAAHETVHWDDDRNGRETLGSKSDWTAGEVRAHALENRLLLRWAGSSFAQGVQDALRSDAFSEPWPSFPGVRRLTQPGIEHLMVLLPQPGLSETENGHRRTSVFFAAVFAQVRDPKRLAVLYTDFATHGVPGLVPARL